MSTFTMNLNAAFWLTNHLHESKKKILKIRIETSFTFVIMKTIIHERSQSGRFVYIFGVLHKKIISPFSAKSTAAIWFSVFVLQISEKKQKGGNKSHSSLHFFQKQIRSLPDWQHPTARLKNQRKKKSKKQIIRLKTFEWWYILWPTIQSNIFNDLRKYDHDGE